MLDPSILSSVHAVETPFPARSEIACGIRFAAPGSSLVALSTALSATAPIPASSKRPLSAEWRICFENCPTVRQSKYYGG